MSDKWGPCCWRGGEGRRGLDLLQSLCIPCAHMCKTQGTRIADELKPTPLLCLTPVCKQTLHYSSLEKLFASVSALCSLKIQTQCCPERHREPASVPMCTCTCVCLWGEAASSSLALTCLLAFVSAMDFPLQSADSASSFAAQGRLMTEL